MFLTPLYACLIDGHVVTYSFEERKCSSILIENRSTERFLIGPVGESILTLKETRHIKSERLAKLNQQVLYGNSSFQILQERKDLNSEIDAIEQKLVDLYQKL